MRCLLLSLVLIFGLAQSQETRHNKAIAQKNTTTENKIAQPAKPAPATEISKSNPVKETGNKPETHAEEKLNLERKLVQYTRELSAFTMWLFIATAILALIAIWQGVQLKNTVDLGRKELIFTHRPKIILRDATSEQDMGELIVVKYVLTNVGDTPAQIVAGAMGVKVFKGWEFGPDNLPAIDGGKSDIDSIALKSGEQVNLSFTSPTLRWSGDNDTCHTFLEPEYGMFFSGQIVYEDDEGTRRHTGFRRKFSSDQHRFLRVDSGPHYEYQD